MKIEDLKKCSHCNAINEAVTKNWYCFHCQSPNGEWSEQDLENERLRLRTEAMRTDERA